MPTPRAEVTSPTRKRPSRLGSTRGTPLTSWPVSAARILPVLRVYERSVKGPCAKPNGEAEQYWNRMSDRRTTEPSKPVAWGSPGGEAHRMGGVCDFFRPPFVCEGSIHRRCLLPDARVATAQQELSLLDEKSLVWGVIVVPPRAIDRTLRAPATRV